VKECVGFVNSLTQSHPPVILASLPIQLLSLEEDQNKSQFHQDHQALKMVHVMKSFYREKIIWLMPFISEIINNI
jgi:hypothetical protein